MSAAAVMTAPTAALEVIPGMDTRDHRPSAIYGAECAWPETNCYIDLWMGILHALDLDPLACASFIFQADFEGDQWTFLKPSLDDLWLLYGIDVQELNIWDSLPSHLIEQIDRGNLPLVEVDSYFLPDTAGIAYRIEHTKTTIGVNLLDTDRERLGYFHNSGYYALEGDDFRSLLQIGAPRGQFLFPYTEFAKLGRRVALPAARLLEGSLDCARRHLARRPSENPVIKFHDSLARQQQAGARGDAVAYYHRYAFATVRQLGAAFQIGAAYARWLGRNPALRLEQAADAMDSISAGAKALLFKMARAANTGRPLQFEECLSAMAAQWDVAFSILPDRLGC